MKNIIYLPNGKKYYCYGKNEGKYVLSADGSTDTFLADESEIQFINE